MCTWCAVPYSQCFKCNSLYCCDCGVNVIKLDKQIGEDELYKSMIEYEKIYNTTHLLQCDRKDYGEEFCLLCLNSKNA